MVYDTARKFFDAVLEASQDAERIQRQLQDMHARAALPSGQSEAHAHVRGGRNRDRLGESVVTLVTAEERLEKRLEADYAMLDTATAILYGTDLDRGLCAFVAPWVADAIYQHYCNGISWPKVARMMNYERRYVLDKVKAAFKIADRNGMTATIEGA